MADAEDKLQDLAIERLVDNVKSDEELERLTVDEKLTDIERAVYLLRMVSQHIGKPFMLHPTNQALHRRGFLIDVSKPTHSPYVPVRS